MKMRTRFQAFASVALAAIVWCPGWASGEVTAGQQIVSLDLGAAVPFAKNGSKAGQFEQGGPGFMGGAQYIYQATPNVGVGLDYGYSAYSNTNVGGISSFDPAATEKNSMQQWHVEALGRYVFMAESKFNPYAIMGLGFNRVSVQSTFNSPAIPLNVETTDGSYTSVAFSLGGGVETEIAKSIVVGCEARWRYMGTHAFNATPAAVAAGAAKAGSTTSFGPASEVTMGLRVGYKFGGK